MPTFRKVGLGHPAEKSGIIYAAVKELRLSILLLLGIPYYAAGQAYTSKGVINYAKAVDVAKA